MLYELANLKKIYGGRTVLDLPTLSLGQGRVIGLLGPNGAGKTTLLEILAFLLTPTSGAVRFGGEPVDFTSDRLIELRRRVVLVQQHPIMFSTSVARNLEFPLKVRKVPKERWGRVIDDLLDLVGMKDFKDAKAYTLSGGETQRVAIARALACSPEVILCDEPTASVDVENQTAIERIIKEVSRRQGISVVFTTHNMIQASRLAEETVFLFHGRPAKSTYENIFSGDLEVADNGNRFCVLQNNLRLLVSVGTVGPVRLSIDPGSVRITRESTGPSPINTFAGRLIQLSDEGTRVRALVDVGVPLSVLFPKEEYGVVSPGLGEIMQVTVPPEAIELV
jgi:tungstate transport system ATP-binding protein